MIHSEESNLSVCAFVFARGGSKGVPGKNLRKINGKSLVCRSIEAARSCPLVDRVIVSTDSREIADEAVQCGADVPFLRPDELAADDSSELLAWQHALNFLQEKDELPGVFLSVPATAPMRLPHDLTDCVERLIQDQYDIVVTVTPSGHNPFFNVVTIDPGGEVSRLSAAGQFVRRQDAPATYDMTTVAYAARPEFVMQTGSLFEGTMGAVIIPPERAIDIDSEFDMKVAEYLVTDLEGARS